MSNICRDDLTCVHEMILTNLRDKDSRDSHPREPNALQYPALSLRVNRENTLNRVPSKQLIFFNYIHHAQKTSVNFNFW